MAGLLKGREGGIYTEAGVFEDWGRLAVVALVAALWRRQKTTKPGLSLVGIR